MIFNNDKVRYNLISYEKVSDIFVQKKKKVIVNKNICIESNVNNINHDIKLRVILRIQKIY